jgi:hypothetical protein
LKAAHSGFLRRRQTSLFLFQHLDHGGLVTVLKLSRIEMACLGIQDVVGASIKGLRRALTENERRAMAVSIVEHLKLRGWNQMTPFVVAHGTRKGA